MPELTETVTQYRTACRLPSTMSNRRTEWKKMIVWTHSIDES